MFANIPAPRVREIRLQGQISRTVHSLGSITNEHLPIDLIEGKIFFLRSALPVDDKDCDALKTNEERNFVRQCAFFLTDVIEKNEEFVFCKRLVFKFIRMYYDDDDDINKHHLNAELIRSLTRRLVRELEWAHWARAKIQPEYQWRTFFLFNTRTWEVSMAPCLAKLRERQASAIHRSCKQLVGVPKSEETKDSVGRVVPDDEGGEVWEGRGTQEEPFIVL